MAKIAVVEDNDAMRAQLCGFIAQYAQESGHQLDVTAFSDGAQLVEPYRPGFDIIFLDIEMPTLGGMPTAERIRRQDPDVVLVFVTNMAQYAIRGYEVDALDFVLKPVSSAPSWSAPCSASSAAAAGRWPCRSAAGCSCWIPTTSFIWKRGTAFCTTTRPRIPGRCAAVC